MTTNDVIAKKLQEANTELEALNDEHLDAEIALQFQQDRLTKIAARRNIKILQISTLIDQLVTKDRAVETA